MLQNDRGYKDLVRDLHSKTFGNRWVAAFELSKVISSKSVKQEDIPWLIENLDDLYESAVDTRTKNFIIVALGSLGDRSWCFYYTKGVILRKILLPNFTQLWRLVQLKTPHLLILA